MLLNKLTDELIDKLTIMPHKMQLKIRVTTPSTMRMIPAIFD